MAGAIAGFAAILSLASLLSSCGASSSSPGTLGAEDVGDIVIVQRPRSIKERRSTDLIITTTVLGLSDGDTWSDSLGLRCFDSPNTPHICDIDLSLDAPAKANCEDLAGSGVTCLLLVDEAPVSWVTFDGGSRIMVGTGEWKFAVLYDPATQVALGVSDTDSSPALTETNIADGLDVRDSARTDVGDFSGLWAWACAEADEFGLDCESAVDDSTFSFLANPDDATQLTIWESDARRTACIPADDEDATDDRPATQITWDETSHTISYATTAAFQESVDDLYVALDSTTRLAILALADRYTTLEARICDRGDSEVFVDEQCKFVTRAAVTADGLGDNNQGGSEIQFDAITSEALAAMTDSTATATSSTADCSSEGGVPAVPCPIGTTLDAEGQGSFAAVSTADGDGLFLVCESPMHPAQTVAFPATSTTKAATLTAYDAMVTGDTGICAQSNVVAYAGMATYKVESIRKILGEMMASPKRSAASVCEGIEPGDDFDFRECSSSDTPPFLCNSLSTIESDLGLEVDTTTGALKASSATSVAVDRTLASALCPTLVTSRGNALDLEDDADDCRTEFVAMSLSAQISALNTWTQRHLSPAQALGCYGGTTVESLWADGFEASCVADIAYERFCDTAGHCGVALACPGSEDASGRCVDDDGLIVGKIRGRWGHALPVLGYSGTGISVGNAHLERWRIRSSLDYHDSLCSFASAETLVADVTTSGLDAIAGRIAARGCQPTHGASELSWGTWAAEEE